MSQPLPLADSPVPDPEYDCQACGACCVSDYEDDTYVHVSLEDLLLLSPSEEDDYVVVESQTGGRVWHLLRTSYDLHGNCRCKALDGTVGEHVSCKIYESRPKVCRRFAPGSSVCLMARRGVLGISEK